MTTLDTTSTLTLFDLATAKDPQGNLATIAEVLTEDNEILLDAMWTMANDTFAHKVVQRLSLPSGQWRNLNDGVGRHAPSSRALYETMGMLADYCVVDKKLYDSAPSKEVYRQNQVNAFLEGMSQTLAATLIYGNASIDTEKFTGLAPRMNATTDDNVFSCGASGSTLTSIYVVQWGETKAHMIYPKGSDSMGVTHEDRGQQTWEGATSNTWFEAMVDYFELNCGFAVEDPRAIGRIANIDYSVASGSTASTFAWSTMLMLHSTTATSGSRQAKAAASLSPE